MSDRPDSVLLRAALRIHASLCAYHKRVPTLALPEWGWTECVQLLRKLQLADSRRWRGASHRLGQRLDRTLQYLQSELGQQSSILRRIEFQPPVTPVAEIVRDLAALREEFDDTEIDLRRRAVTVQTDRIVLEDVRLGPFQIRLEWSRFDDLPHYEVIAVEPVLAAGDEDTTHPHVQGNQLCEGDGKSAIREALESGRLLDFFLLVRQILQTYNSASAYVQLDEWDAGCCSDCGGAVRDDDIVCCQ